MKMAEKILNHFKISKPQRTFLVTLFTAILTTRGKINFRNLSRFSEVSEETYSRHYAKPFEFMAFNREVIDEALGKESERIVAYDPSFITKSGKKTYGVNSFWNGCHRRSEKGLEIATLAIVDIQQNTGFALATRQTEPAQAIAKQGATASPQEASEPDPVKKTAPQKGRKKKRKTPSKKSRRKEETEDETLIDQYLQQLREAHPFLRAGETHIVVDGAFAKKKYVDGVCELGLHVVGKLRRDANMRYLYTGPKREKGSGRQKIYDGKVNWQDLSSFDYVGCEEGIEIYTLLLNHVSLKRTVRVVVLRDTRTQDKTRQTILFSTDTALEAQTLLSYYKARFQIEFIFRDAKQFTGLCDSQARDQKRLDFHFNASLTTLNLAKLEHLKAASEAPMPFSMASVKAGYFNTFFLQKIFLMLDLDLNLIKKSPLYQKLQNYGKIAA
jgi:hypothetical protein